MPRQSSKGSTRMSDPTRQTPVRASSALAIAEHHRQGASVLDTVQAALAQARSAAAKHAFISLRPDEACEAAKQLDALPAAARNKLPLLGVPLSVKDLYDEAGQLTRAGSSTLSGAVPAAHDALAVARLKAAGAVVVGRTNMSEFAFSGLGLNPHFGTPRNPADTRVARIPGGSSSGAAVSVALGAAAIGLGSDTGGSIRIPAALCGITGFKPTQSCVPLDGTLPLSTTLDTACAMTTGVADAVAVFEVLAGRKLRPPVPRPPDMHLVVPEGELLEDMDATVHAAFSRAVEALVKAGCTIERRALAPIAELPTLQAQGSFSNAEAYAWHEARLAEHAAGYDPRVLARILRGRDMSAAQYVRLTWARRDWVARMNAALGSASALLCPTVPRVAPRIDEVASDDDFFRLNALMLRNTAMVNFWDGCAISLPCHAPAAGELPVGLMLAAPGGRDEALLGLALHVESLLRSAAP